MTTWIVLALTVVLTGFAQVCLKLGVQSLLVHGETTRGILGLALALATEWRLLGGLVLYGVATLTWLFVLSRLPLSVAYPFVGLSFVTVTALSALLLHEHIVPLQAAGTLLIALGVVLVAASGKLRGVTPAQPRSNAVGGGGDIG